MRWDFPCRQCGTLLEFDLDPPELVRDPSDPSVKIIPLVGVDYSTKCYAPPTCSHCGVDIQHNQALLHAVYLDWIFAGPECFGEDEEEDEDDEVDDAEDPRSFADEDDEDDEVDY